MLAKIQMMFMDHSLCGVIRTAGRLVHTEEIGAEKRQREKQIL